MKKNTNLIPHTFEIAIGKGVSKGQAKDMALKHLSKLRFDVETRNAEVELEALKEKISKNPDVVKMSRLKRELKELKIKQFRATELYLGGVSTGLTDFCPGKSLAEKLGILNGVAYEGNINKTYLIK